MVEGAAQELLTDINSEGSFDDRSVFSEAIDFLKFLLSDGPVPKKEVDDRAKEAGIKSITLRRAKTFLGVETVHDGYGKGSVWKWSLPLAKVIKIDKGAHANGMSTIDNNDHLLKKIY